jgi:hypothetical protein
MLPVEATRAAPSTSQHQPPVEPAFVTSIGIARQSVQLSSNLRDSKNAMIEPRLVTPDDPTWSGLVDNLDRPITCGMNCGHRLGCHRTDVWSAWDLRHLDFAPSMLRGGRLPAVWPMWRERYGDFGVDRPSEPMKGFLAARGYAPRDSPLEVREDSQRPSVLDIDRGYWTPLG